MVLHLPFKSRQFKPLFCFICFAVCHTAWDRLCRAINGSGQYTSWLVLTPPYFAILYFSVYVCMWENVVWRGRCLCTYRCMRLYRRCLSLALGRSSLMNLKLADLVKLAEQSILGICLSPPPNAEVIKHRYQCHSQCFVLFGCWMLGIQRGPQTYKARILTQGTISSALNLHFKAQRIVSYFAYLHRISKGNQETLINWKPLACKLFIFSLHINTYLFITVRLKEVPHGFHLGFSLEKYQNIPSFL